MPNQTINLNYNLSNWTLTASSNTPPANPGGSPHGTAAAVKPAAGQQSVIHAKKDDHLTWESKTPGVTDFFVYLEPANAFEPNVFAKDSKEPVKVKRTVKNAHAWCGFVSGGKLYGYPIDKNYGHSIDP